MSVLHPRPLLSSRIDFLAHGPEFLEYPDTLPAPKRFICHQLSHAASAFWLSGLDEALCLTYDGGMCNSPWFGGLYRSTRADGITPLDRFASSHYAKITSLYTIVTGLLGFSPNKHEGKITGLSAYGRPTARCRRVLERLFTTEYANMESMVEWRNQYSRVLPPMLVVNSHRRDELRREFGNLSKEEIAATLQDMTEEHVLDILARARERGWYSRHICLSGGLFANVKLNQRIKEAGFETLFVSPPMTDDGTALGAALALASSGSDFSPRPASDVFWGPEFGSEAIESALKEQRLSYRLEHSPAEFIARALEDGRVVGIFQGRMEFGPRALGNRSILSPATSPEINVSLNTRLRRTEFMPFAPITRLEDAADCYCGLDGVDQSAAFMTITCACTERMRQDVPAVVHVDGTARPQLVRRETNPLIHDILTVYRRQTGRPALINTSFNVHEEPIVCSPSDAIRGFLEAGLDYLYFEGGYLASFDDNLKQAADVLRQRLMEPSLRELQLASTNDQLHRELTIRLRELVEKEQVILSLSSALKQVVVELDTLEQLTDPELIRLGVTNILRRLRPAE